MRISERGVESLARSMIVCMYVKNIRRLLLGCIE